MLIYVAFYNNTLMRKLDILSRSRNQPVRIKHAIIIQKKKCKFRCLYSYMQKMYVNYAMFIFISDRLFDIWTFSTVCRSINSTFQRGKSAEKHPLTCLLWQRYSLLFGGLIYISDQVDNWYCTFLCCPVIKNSCSCWTQLIVSLPFELIWKEFGFMKSSLTI